MTGTLISEKKDATEQCRDSAVRQEEQPQDRLGRLRKEYENAHADFIDSVLKKPTETEAKSALDRYQKASTAYYSAKFESRTRA